MMIQGNIFKAIFISSIMIELHICLILQSDLGYLASLEPVPIQIIKLAAHESYSHTHQISWLQFIRMQKNAFINCFHICNKLFTVHIN